MTLNVRVHQLDAPGLPTKADGTLWLQISLDPPSPDQTELILDLAGADRFSPNHFRQFALACPISDVSIKFDLFKGPSSKTMTHVASLRIPGSWLPPDRVVEENAAMSPIPSIHSACRIYFRLHHDASGTGEFKASRETFTSAATIGTRSISSWPRTAAMIGTHSMPSSLAIETFTVLSEAPAPIVDETPSVAAGNPPVVEEEEEEEEEEERREQAFGFPLPPPVIAAQVQEDVSGPDEESARSESGLPPDETFSFFPTDEQRNGVYVAPQPFPVFVGPPGDGSS
jgi:hypothetical protein